MLEEFQATLIEFYDAVELQPELLAELIPPPFIQKYELVEDIELELQTEFANAETAVMEGVAVNRFS